jgi:hypothetical protein
LYLNFFWSRIRVLLRKVTWNSFCFWGRLPGTAHTPGEDYLEQLLPPKEGYLEQLMLLEKVTWSGSCLYGEGP